MKRRLIQIASGLNPDDAASKHVTTIWQATSRRGAPFSETRNYAEAIHPALPFPAKPLRKYQHRPGDVLFVHYSMALDALPQLLNLPAPIAIYYQNISPAEKFLPWDLHLAGRLQRARNELRALVARADLLIAASPYSAVELAATGGANVRSIDLLIPDLPPPAPRRLPFGDRSINLLFAGRVLPHKGHTRLIETLYYLRRMGGDARLVLAGDTPPGMAPFAAALREFADRLGLGAAIEWRGMVDRAQLESLYRNADAFLCASEHEGFCAPLLEAMAADLPVFAWTTPPSAVKDTLQGAGIDLGDLSAVAAAGLLLELAGERGSIDALIEGQRQRLRRYDLAASRERIVHLLAALADGDVSSARRDHGS